ncbi:unnamed protein product [Symbiodinium sp. CCMP2592]|nr:unnamed protein product [Symbiodinium sp. CCMP2592]
MDASMDVQQAAAQQAAQAAAAQGANQAQQQEAAQLAAQAAAAAQAATAAQGVQATAAGAAEIDRIVRQRMEQAFQGVFGRLLETTQQAAKAAESQAVSHRNDSLVRALKCDQWKPSSREDELRTWKEWWFSFSNFVIAHDPAYEQDFADLLDSEHDTSHALLDTKTVERSQRLYGLLCSMVKGRPLLLIKGAEVTKNGLEAVRILRNAMEPKEKARSLAIMRQLASWQFSGGNLHEQLVKYEEALKTYEAASGKEFPPELVLATVVTGLKEPLRSQIQLRMGPKTTYQDIREWVLQHESLNSPWATSLGKASGSGYDSDGKGWQSQPWTGQGGGKSWQQAGSWGQGGKQGAGGGKGKKLDPSLCAICWQRGHWKNECPNKGKGKVNQIEQGPAASNVPSSASSASTAASTLPSSASALRGVQRVELAGFAAEPGFSVAEVFDMSELDDWDVFGSGGPQVMMIKGHLGIEYASGGLVAGGAAHALLEGVPHFAMDASDKDGEWTYEPGLSCGVLALETIPGKEDVEIVIDSGADVQTRLLDLEVPTSTGETVCIREKFSIARISSVLRRNTLIVAATVSMVVAAGLEAPLEAKAARPINMLTFDDLGPLPKEVEACARRPGWHVLPSGLPLLVQHRVTELEFEQSLWSQQDWPWLAIFARHEAADRLPQEGDVWLQVATMATEQFENAPKTLVDMDPDLDGPRDVMMLLHVEQLPKDLLSSPRDFFCEPADDNSNQPVPVQDDSSGVGVLPDEIALQEKPTEELEDEDGEPELEGVALNVGTPLRELRALCSKLGLSSSGGKDKVLRRLKLHHEVLEKQMANEIARKMFAEQEREPTMPKTPVLPSSRQQELHNVTHHPFQPWCEACVMGRSKQSPHSKAGGQMEGEEVAPDARVHPMIQIDYGYTFTRHRHEVEAEGDQEKAEPEEDKSNEPNQEGEADDPRDQFGLCLVGVETTTGWVCSIPVLEKGARSLKRVTEQLVRLSLQTSPGDTVTIQGDPEASIKQIVNSFETCRAKLGLATNKRLVPRGSHSSNSYVEKAIDTVRRNAVTLKAFLESRIGASIPGSAHVYAWFFKHSAFLYNRFHVGTKGGTAHEVMFSRRYKGQLVPFGELVIFYKHSPHKGDLQWRKGIWLGINERNNAHVLGTAEGCFESRSIRRVPEEEKWNSSMVLGVKGFPWSYQGQHRRKRPLYTGARSAVPLLPDNATLEELARAAGHAAAEAIASRVPVDEAASDPPSSSSSSTTSSTPSSRNAGNQGSNQQQPQQEQGNQQQPSGAIVGSQPGDQGSSQQLQQERGNQQQPSAVLVEQGGTGGPVQEQGGTGGPGNLPQEAMDVSGSSPSRTERPAATGEGHSKRPRLLLDKPKPTTGVAVSLPQPAASSAPTSPSAGLYPPGFAGVMQVHGDIPTEELVGFEGWDPDLLNEMISESELAGEFFESWWDEFAEKPPQLSEAELSQVDAEADKREIERLMSMGVLRHQRHDEDISGYQSLTTKVVRDWRKRPGWTRRSRLVGREFKTMSPYTQELFAPASTLGATHAFIATALSLGLQLATFDFKDAYLQVEQPTPMTVEIDGKLFGDPEGGSRTMVLDRLLPGQRIGASAWYLFAKDLLRKASLTNFEKEPTLFRSTVPGSQAGVVLHADDGLLASTEKERNFLKGLLREKVTVEFIQPLLNVGDELEFLKRKYVMMENGIAVYSNGRYVEALLGALGPKLRGRDSPSDQSFLEQDTTTELTAHECKVYREAVGRLLYLSHTRPDVQFAVCVLSSKMASPTKGAFKWLQRVVGYLAECPPIGFLIKPISGNACVGYDPGERLVPGSTIVVEAVTDADWAGCRRTRKSHTSIQLYVGGSLLSSMVRSQRSIALSSGESEYIALVAGAAEGIYLADCVRFFVNGAYEVELRSRTDSSACKGITQRLGCGRIRHIACNMLWVQQCVKQGILKVATIPGTANPSDLGTKPLSGSRIRELLYMMGAVLPDGSPYGGQDKELADQKREMARVMKELKNDGHRVSQIKALMPILLIMSQVQQTQGLSLAAPLVAMWDTETLYSMAATLGITLLTLVVFFGLPYSLLKFLKWCFRTFSWRPARCSTGSQTERARPVVQSCGPKVKSQKEKDQEKFAEEYVNRYTELQQIFSEKCRENEMMENMLYELRTENRALQEALRRAEERRTPPERYLEDGRDWRKVSPLEIQRQLRACDLPLWRRPKGPKMTGLEVARAAPMAERLEGLLAAVVAGILQAVDQGCFWGPGYEVPRWVKIQGVPSPMSRLVLLPSIQRATPLEVGAGGLKASDLLAVDVAAEAALREAKPKVGLVRFSARRLPGLRRLDLTDPLLFRSSYCKALMEMERQLHAPLPTLEADAVVATSDVSILRGPVEAGAPWTENQPARIEVFWAQLERNPHFDDLGYLDEAVSERVAEQRIDCEGVAFDLRIFLACAWADEKDASCMLQQHGSAQRSTKPAFLEGRSSLAGLPSSATCKKKFTDDKVCKTTSGVDCQVSELNNFGKCWFSETHGSNPCLPKPVAGTWTTAKVDFGSGAGHCIKVPPGICPVQICVKSGSPNSAAGRACYSGKQTCGIFPGLPALSGKVDETFCTTWTAPSLFCVVSLATNANNPNNIQDLSNFAIQFGCCDGSGGVVGDPHIHTLDGNEFDLYDKGTYSVFHYGGTGDIDWQLYATYGGPLWTVQGLLLVDRSKGRFRQAMELTSEDCQWRSKTGHASWSVIERNASLSLLEGGEYVTAFEYVNEKHVNLGINTPHGKKEILVLNTVCMSGAINLRVSPRKAFEAKFLTGQIQAGNAKSQERFPVEESWQSLGGTDSAASFLKKNQEEKHLLVTSCTGDAKTKAEDTCAEYLGEETRESGSFFDDCVFDVCRGGEKFAKAAAELRSLI